MESLSHTPFIAGAYIVFFGVLFGVAAATLWRAHAAKKQADKLEAQQPRRQRRKTS